MDSFLVRIFRNKTILFIEKFAPTLGLQYLQSSFQTSKETKKNMKQEVDRGSR